MTARRVAVIGSGIAGLSAARALSAGAQVTLFEADARFGGHAHTVNVTLDGITHGVDTGFLVFNDRTYPGLIELYRQLGVASMASEMSFSVQLPEPRLEWAGTNVDSVFAQRSNLFKPRFWRMLRDIVRFNRLTTAIAERGAEDELMQPLSTFLAANGFCKEFSDWYFLPMLGCIWSCPADQMLAFPVATMIRFCHNHGLLRVVDRPQWRSVVGGSQAYVRKVVEDLDDARANTPVRAVRRHGAGVDVVTDLGTDRFDDVVMACHSDQSLALLADADDAEQQVLGAIRYQSNHAVLHTDARLLPKNRRAWAAWNYERAAAVSQEQNAVCLHYLINRLQPLPWTRPVIVSLNPARAPDAATVLGRYTYAHPVFDQAAIAAQRRLHTLQGNRHVWFCGAWTRYGFHEDGLRSGLEVAAALMAGAQAEREAA